MTHQEICNGKLIIVDPVDMNYISDGIPKLLKHKADIILEDLHDGTYAVLKNRNGGVGDIVDQKEVTKIMLKL